MQNTTRKIAAIYLIIVFLIIYLPIFHMIAFSFQPTAAISYPLQGFSLFWYNGRTVLGLQGGFLNDQTILSLLRNSIINALVVAALATFIILGAALTIRKPIRGQRTIFYLLLLGMIIPGTNLGITNLLVFKNLGVPLSMWTTVAVHLVYVMPFGLLVLLPRFDPLLLRYEEAARMLYASPWKVFKEITFPLIRTQVISIVLFSFTLSLGELNRSFFVSSPAQSTLPVYIYSLMTGQPATPKFYALGTVITAASLILLVMTGILLTHKRVK